MELRPELGSKPSLTRWRSSRGAKVEIYHGSSRYFANQFVNQGTNHGTFQILKMVGTARLNAGPCEEAKQQAGATTTTARVPHLRRAALPAVGCGGSATASGAEPRLPQPHPYVGTTRPTNNGERSFMGYAFEQATPPKKNTEYRGQEGWHLNLNAH